MAGTRLWRQQPRGGTRLSRGRHGLAAAASGGPARRSWGPAAGTLGRRGIRHFPAIRFAATRLRRPEVACGPPSPLPRSGCPHRAFRWARWGHGSSRPRRTHERPRPAGPVATLGCAKLLLPEPRAGSRSMDDGVGLGFYWRSVRLVRRGGYEHPDCSLLDWKEPRGPHVRPNSIGIRVCFSCSPSTFRCCCSVPGRGWHTPLSAGGEVARAGPGPGRFRKPGPAPRGGRC
jgi:hypothetical protein